jgi:nucleotide-binding universal stress UspA family protein
MPVRGLVHGHLSVQSILFATDFSPASHPASLYAVALAAHFGCVLTLAHVFLPSQSAQEAEAKEGIVSEQRRLLQQRLELTTSVLARDAGKATSVLLEGDPSVVIPKLANEFSDAILVLGTHGGGSLGRHLLGSVAESILRKTAIPTLTAGQQVITSSKAPPFQRILYVTDSSPVASQAAPLACAFASSFSSRLEVVSVVDEREGAVAQILAELDFRTQQELAANLVERCIHFQEPRSVTYSRQAHDEILRRLQEDSCDLLVLGIAQKSSLGFADRDSGAFRLIADSPCPVLTITEEVSVRSGLSRRKR